MFKILTLNNIRVGGLDRMPRDKYEIASEISNPDAILLRSADMHNFEIPKSLKAVGRAGAGVNNIPVAKMSALGIPVFNTPGANANAVKELVVAGMLLSARNLGTAFEFTRKLSGSDSEINEVVESQKKSFVGIELAGRTLGVVGLGAIGVRVANAALAMGMRVIGHDPHITVTNAWALQAEVKNMPSVSEVLANCDFVTFHVPLSEETKNLLDGRRLSKCRPGITILNFSRAGIVDEKAVSEAILSGKVRAYVCDFPSNLLTNHERVITLPHLGASTEEAEENCAVMVVEQIRDFLEQGTIRNTVNFPEMTLPRNGGHRLLVANSNIPHMIERISAAVAKENLNIVDMLNRSRGEVACTLVDVERAIPHSVIDEISKIDGVLSARVLS
ncbi:MAG: 3-phosphoglycerate dehydrogenase [Cyanobacteria bacterium SZAS LIN-2]|nr:3-phosphoglycerate dehydrogenase [Cyanobacteria bacterium SZAS LIN-3]MBS1995329.1 3-phosphoglycerate dehydrogenase [Cyanobacteria bacterium SZAS LIN-2]MBS2009723.1 3-phosphoglycerate dehydrogenase [Cyanobacteria bacterium SZAS TMP-1]